MADKDSSSLFEDFIQLISSIDAESFAAEAGKIIAQGSPAKIAANTIAALLRGGSKEGAALRRVFKTAHGEAVGQSRKQLGGDYSEEEIKSIIKERLPRISRKARASFLLLIAGNENMTAEQIFYELTSNQPAESGQDEVLPIYWEYFIKELLAGLRDKAGKDGSPLFNFYAGIQFDRIQEGFKNLNAKWDRSNSPRLIVPRVDNNEKNRFSFRSNHIPFQEAALQDVFERMSQFIAVSETGSDKKFLAYAIAGPAGAGKSRFALEFCNRAIGWHSGFLASTVNDGIWSNWNPVRPTIIVVDYAGDASRDIGTVLKILSERDDLHRPVRMLLLEREGMKPGDTGQPPQWFSTILAKDKPLITDHWHDYEAQPILTLPCMTDDDLWTLMQCFLSENGHHCNREELFKQLIEIDPKKRPLTAAFLADARSHSTNDFSTIEDVLQDYLDREEERYWKPVSNKEQLLKDKHLLVIATVVGGLNCGKEEPENFPKEYCTSFKEICGDTDRFRAFGGIDENHYLPQMEPDILGEYFVLSNYSGRDKETEQFLKYTAGIFLTTFFPRAIGDFPNNDNLVKLTSAYLSTLEASADQPIPIGGFILLASAYSGSNKLVKKLLSEHQIEVNAVDTKDGTFSLLLASQNGHVETVKELISQGADVNAVNTKDGKFPLLVASQQGHVETVKLLLEEGAEVNAVNADNGAFPLLLASHQGHVETVKELISRGADVNAVNTKDGKFPLLVASQQGHVETVKLLLEEGAEVNAVNADNGAFPLFLASQNGHVETVKLLLEEGAEVNAVNMKNGNFPLLLASEQGHVEAVKLLLEEGAEVNAVNMKNGNFPLLQASHQGHVETVKLLLEEGAEVNAVHADNGAFPLLVASHQGHVEAVKELISRGADVNAVNTKDGYFPLLVASQNGHVETVKLLLEEGAEVNAVNMKNGNFPLLLASEQGHVETVKELISRGADVNAVHADNGAFPLLLASQNGHVETVKLLLEEGAEVNAVHADTGVFPLLQASQNGHVETVKLLLEEGAEVNAVNTKDGTFPLLLASHQGHVEAVRELI